MQRLYCSYANYGLNSIELLSFRRLQLGFSAPPLPGKLKKRHF